MFVVITRATTKKLPFYYVKETNFKYEQVSYKQKDRKIACKLIAEVTVPYQRFQYKENYQG